MCSSIGRAIAGLREVLGSNPGTADPCVAQSVEQSPGLREVLGSNPGTADQCFSAILVTPT